jgi:hypothetical protein
LSGIARNTLIVSFPLGNVTVSVLGGAALAMTVAEMRAILTIIKTKLDLLIIEGRLQNPIVSLYRTVRQLPVTKTA